MITDRAAPAQTRMVLLVVRTKAKTERAAAAACVCSVLHGTRAKCGVRVPQPQAPEPHRTVNTTSVTDRACSKN